MLDSFLWGSPHKPCVVLLHGLFGDKADWQPIVTRLNENYCYLMVDILGHGQSGFPLPFIDNKNYFYLFSKLLIKKIHKKELQPHGIVGYSLGGRLGLELIKTFPYIFKMGIFESTHIGLSYQCERDLRAIHDKVWSHKFIIKNSSDFFYLWYQTPLWQSLRNDNKLFIEQKSTKIDKYQDYEMKDKGYYAMRAFTLSKQKSSIPLLNRADHFLHFFWGANDVKFSSIGKDLLNRGFKNCYHTFFENEGHNIHLENPDRFVFEVNRILENYLNYQS